MQYVFLVRHGRRDEIGDAQTEEVARKLVEVFDELPPNQRFDIPEILSGPSKETQQAAKIFEKVLPSSKATTAQESGARQLLSRIYYKVVPGSLVSRIHCLEQLSPGDAGHSPYEPSDKDKMLASEFRSFLRGEKIPFSTSQGSFSPATNAILVVSHQPYIGWLTQWILGKPVPIDRSELLCIIQKKPTDSPRLLWILTPSPPKGEEDTAFKDICEKIKSKMDVAKVLGALIIPGLGLFLGSLLDASKLDGFDKANRPIWALYFSVFFLLVALSFYLATVYAYDRLLMPPRFWREKPSGRDRPAWLVRRPPSSATWVLYQNMMHVWTWLFMPATFFVVVGLALLAYFVLAPPFPLLLSITVFLVLGVIISLAMFVYYYWHRPRLGTED